MFETHTYQNTLPDAALYSWEFAESNSACAIMQAVCPNEWKDILDLLCGYRIDPKFWLKPGGNRGDIAKEIDNFFYQRGWLETKLDLATRGILRDSDENVIGSLPEVYQEGYLVDNFKNRIALDVEWNAKDGNLDRDLSAYRSWYEAGIISAAVIITKDRLSLLELARELWSIYQNTLPENNRTAKLPIDLTTSTTTSMDKAKIRLRRGVMGTCPVLIVAANRSTWNGDYIY